MKFEVTPEQIAQIDAWKKSLDERMIAKQKESMSAEDFSLLTMDATYPYTGAIGGNMSYSFTPTSLGVVLVVTHSFSGESINLTDYDSW